MAPPLQVLENIEKHVTAIPAQQKAAATQEPVMLMRYDNDARHQLTPWLPSPLPLSGSSQSMPDFPGLHRVCMTNHWDSYHRHWKLLDAPLRPTPETVGLFERELDLGNADVLLLGVTPELAVLGRSMLAIDQSAAMISGVWAGDNISRRAMAGNWLDLPVERECFDAVIGDGCLSAVDTKAARGSLFGEIARVLKPGRHAAIRVFARPETADDLRGIEALVLAGGIENFHALKWRIAMACTTGDCDSSVDVQAIRAAFDKLFPDREALAACTGWSMASINTIDVYAGSETRYSFATLAMLVDEARGWFDQVRVVPSGSYPLAERCPLLVLGSAKLR
ncbi:class I SAM-dependent methyltransferase [Mesorhizobium sp. B2-3-15]|uniref:class I SAM-dependent methyltransferase n=1 Tax=Mesorhizobium sp. B2-3-15 TaxID=2589949 RepID=UPI001FEE20C7|nr:class I SAM-dependent methyltransferase [Mesorhizobium sp. B2-3-15]